MKSYVWLTFAFMGWGYYEMSGGSDFEPVERVTAAVEVQNADIPETVTRASTPTLLAVSTSNIAAPAAAGVTPVVAVEPAAEAEVIAVVAPVVEPVIDLRAVGSSRVNMRMGPGTNYEVITTLNSGTEIEVISVNADGWANVSVMSNGIEGWMAERLLTEPQT